MRLKLFIGSACGLAGVTAMPGSPLPVTGMSRSGNQVLSLTVNGAAIGQDRLQTGVVSAFAGQTPSVVLAPAGAVPATGAAAEAYLTDFLFDSGLINPAVSPAAVTLAFSPPLVNRPGPEVVLLEINGASPADSFQITINGLSQTVAGSQFGSTGFSTSGASTMATRNAGNTADVVVTSLTQLQAAPLAVSSTSISQQVYGVALDLSDFGVAEGGGAGSVQLGSAASGSNFDPVFIAGITPPVEVTSGVIISEFLTDNGEGIEDDDGSKPDWIELYNGSAGTVDVAGWGLSNNAATPLKWLIPAGTVLQPFEYRLVFASSKNRTTAPLHTNFNLSKSAGYIGLSRPDGGVASSFTYGAQTEDVSYGIKGAALTPGFLATPTPGSANLGMQSPGGRAADVVFSAASGVIAADFQLAMSLPAGESGTIRFTTDLSEPTEASAVYSTPVAVANSATIRARVFRAGFLPGLVGNRHFISMAADVRANYRDTGQPFRSNLPVLVLDSFGANVDGNTSQGAPYRATLAAVYEPAAGGMTSLGAVPSAVLRGGTHVRGQSSASFPQRQYAWELWRENFDEDEKLPLLGMPAGADWVLHAPWNDKSLMRNALAYGLARDWAAPGAGMRTRFVEVFFNQTGTSLDYADYRGVYLLVEEIKRDEERVDVEELTPLGRDLTGGYLFAKDKPPYDNGFSTTTTSAWGGQPLDMIEPGEPTGAQLDYLRNYMNGFEAALAGTNFANPATGYAAYIDARSFQDWHLMAEFARQTDAYQNSNYFHKRRGQLVKALPVWDFNLSYANNSETPDGGSAQPGQGPGEGWHWIRLFDDWLSQKGPSHYPWFPRLFQDPEFVRGYWDRYWEKRNTVLGDGALAARIEALAAEVSGGLPGAVTNGTGIWPASIPSVESPAGRHFARWQILGTYVWTTPIGWQDRTTHAHEVDLLKRWLLARVEWMDTQSMATTPTTTVPAVASPVARPPLVKAAGSTAFSLFNPNAGSSAAVLYTVNGPDPRLAGGGTLAQAVSAPAGEYAASELVAIGTDWKFLAPAGAPPVSWKDDGFDDAGWATVSNVREQIRPATTYFRKAFTVGGTGALQSVLFDLLVDDGAVVWLNGVELRRAGMPFPPTPVTHATAATGLIDKAHEGEWITWLSPAGLLREGSNTLAVEVHQYSHANGVTQNGDLSFELRVRGLAPGNGTPIPISGQDTRVVRARVRNGNNWSPLAEVSFSSATVPASAANLVVGELMYHPADATAGEGAFGDNDFEFIELANIGVSPVDLAGVTLADAVTFSFDSAPSGARILPPGGRVVVVANQAAFAARYPGSPVGIAGVFSGNFNNSTEQVSVLAPGGAVIRRFTYTDAEPWPVDADGGGASLVLNALADLDHTVPANWHASALVNGVPGGEDHASPPPDPTADPDGNGLSNFMEFALGGTSMPALVLESFPTGGEGEARHAVFRFRRNLAAGGLTYEAQSCDNLADWAPGALIHTGTVRQSDGTAVVTYRSALPYEQLPTKFFVRLRVR